MNKNELTALIAKNWREIDPEVKSYVSKLAKAEKTKYMKLTEDSATTGPSSTSAAPPLPVIWHASLASTPEHQQQQALPSSSRVLALPPHSVSSVSLANPPEHQQQQVLTSTVQKSEELMSPPEMDFCKNHSGSMNSGSFSDEEMTTFKGSKDSSTQLGSSLNGASIFSGSISDAELSLFDSKSVDYDDFQFDFNKDTDESLQS